MASEVKSLATQTAKATEDIGAQIASIQRETGAVVEDIRDITRHHYRDRWDFLFDGFRGRRAGIGMQEIVGNVQQAAARTNEVPQNILSVTEGIATTETAARKILGSAAKLATQSEALRE